MLSMHKEDIIRLHALLYQIMTVYVKKGMAAKTDFEAYEKLGVTPLSLHRDRTSHRMAIFLLGEALSKASVAISDNELKHELTFIQKMTRLPVKLT